MVLIEFISEVQEVINEVAEGYGRGKTYFDTPVTIELNPFPISIYGVYVHKNDSVWLMDGNENWHNLTATDNNAACVAGAIFERLNVLA